MKFNLFFIIALCLGVTSGCKQHNHPEQIRQLINKTFDRPDSKVKIEPVVMAESYAIADWVQDTKAGRALLKMENGKWRLLACGGSGMKTAASLMQQGVPEAVAVKLSQLLSDAEKTLQEKEVEGFDSFGPSVIFSDSNPHHSHH